MNSSILLSVTTFVYGFAAFFYVSSVVFKKPFLGRMGTWTALAGILGNVCGILLRWLESYQFGIGHAPLSNLYESLIFFSFVIAVIYLVVEKTYENRSIGAFTIPLAFFAMAYASLSPNISERIQPLLPALKSNWLIAHVVACFIGYAAFAIAFGLGIMFLLKQKDSSHGAPLLKFFPDLYLIDELSHQMIMFGFLFLTTGIITGAVWANSAWGRYWGWDPKETWSLITWFIYATLLHARFMRGWRGKRLAYLSIIGFTAVLFTYFGVNYLPGLHSYGQ
ncbi:MAG: c-type cytochrome biogenesis protein CcsB [Proteobacteria bacterium]|nr:c-type cytochrome biogenesis protein CcsB [Pseudomonadota bacterium]